MTLPMHTGKSKPAEIMAERETLYRELIFEILEEKVMGFAMDEWGFVMIPDLHAAEGSTGECQTVGCIGGFTEMILHRQGKIACTEHRYNIAERILGEHLGLDEHGTHELFHGAMDKIRRDKGKAAAVLERLMEKVTRSPHLLSKSEVQDAVKQGCH